MFGNVTEIKPISLRAATLSVSNLSNTAKTYLPETQK